MSTITEGIALLRDGLDVLASADPRDLPAGARGEAVVELSALARRLESELLRAVGAFDAAGDAALDGGSSSAAWLRWQTHLAPGAARRQVRTARRVAELPEMADAHAAGQISAAHVDVVVRAMDRSEARRETIAKAEATFAQAAREMDPPSLAKVVARWAHTVDPLDALAQERELHAQRRLTCSRTFEGAVHLEGLLPPEAGALVMTALEALGTEAYRVEQAAREEAQGSAGAVGSAGVAGSNVAAGAVARPGCDAEPPTPAQRRADALTELCRRYLDCGQAPEIKGFRPHLSLLVSALSLAAPRGQAGHAPATLGEVGPISAEAARRIGCDAAITPFCVDEFGQPLSYGRTQRLVPPTLRRYLNVRDLHCVFPGCQRPPGWCEAHHLKHWSQGGETSAANTALTCSHHHHVLHEGGFTTRGSPEDGSLRFYRPNGTQITDATDHQQDPSPP